MLPLTPWGFRKTSYSVSSRIYKRSKLDLVYLGSRVDHHLSHCVAERKPFPTFCAGFLPTFLMISFLSSIIIKCWGKLELVDPLEKLWKTENNGAYQGSENMLVDGRGKSVWWSHMVRSSFSLVNPSMEAKIDSIIQLISWSFSSQHQRCRCCISPPQHNKEKKPAEHLIITHLTLNFPSWPLSTSWRDARDQKVEDYSTRGQH